MHNLTERIRSLKVPGGIFNLNVVYNEYPKSLTNARKSLVNRAYKKGDICRLSKGYYYLSKKYSDNLPHPFLIANILEYPSFVSMESALSFHQLIPEAIYQVSAITTRKSHIVKTSIAYFYYYTVPVIYFKAGVKVEKIANEFYAFIASPLRAIADIIYYRKKVCWSKDNYYFLTNSLRIEEEQLSQLDYSFADEIIENIKNKRTVEYIDKLRNRFSK